MALVRDGIEELLPSERVTEGGYTLVGGDSTVGTCALCLVYTQGYRDLHIFGYDTSYRDGKSHAYKQDINRGMPTMKVEWAGREFVVSMAMRNQAEKFMLYSQALKADGCEFHVYGDGFLQTMYNTPVSELSEREKYQLMWSYDNYRKVSPGEYVAHFYLDNFDIKGKIIDFGCGTGRAGVIFAEKEHDVLLIDFTDNSRDESALDIPFLLCDLTQTIPVKAEHGFCTDVMEHIPPQDVELVIKNIMESADKVFFQISTVDDVGGQMIGATLHLTVKPHNWWKDLFKELGFKVDFARNLGDASLFYVSK